MATGTQLANRAVQRNKAANALKRADAVLKGKDTNPMLSKSDQKQAVDRYVEKMGLSNKGSQGYGDSFNLNDVIPGQRIDGVGGTLDTYRGVPTLELPNVTPDFMNLSKQDFEGKYGKGSHASTAKNLMPGYVPVKAPKKGNYTPPKGNTNSNSTINNPYTQAYGDANSSMNNMSYGESTQQPYGDQRYNAALLAGGLGYGAYQGVKSLLNNAQSAIPPSSTLARIPTYVQPATATAGRGVQQVVGTVLNGAKALPNTQWGLPYMTRAVVPYLGRIASAAPTIPTPIGGMSLFGNGVPEGAGIWNNYQQTY